MGCRSREAERPPYPNPIHKSSSRTEAERDPTLALAVAAIVASPPSICNNGHRKERPPDAPRQANPPSARPNPPRHRTPPTLMYRYATQRNAPHPPRNAYRERLSLGALAIYRSPRSFSLLPDSRRNRAEVSDPVREVRLRSRCKDWLDRSFHSFCLWRGKVSQIEKAWCFTRWFHFRASRRFALALESTQRGSCDRRLPDESNGWW